MKRTIVLLILLVSTSLFAKDNAFLKEADVVPGGEIARLSVEAAFYSDFTLQAGERLVYAQKTSITWRDGDSYDVNFKVLGAKHESSITFHDGVMAGFFFDEKNRLMEIVPVDGGYRVAETPKLECDVLVPEHTEEEMVRAHSIAEEAGRKRLVSRTPPPAQAERVDIFIAMSDDALRNVGGEISAEAIFRVYEAYMNLALKNSGYPHKSVKIVGSKVFDFDEALDESTGLNWATGNPLIHEEMQRAKADITVLWREMFAGLAWLDLSFRPKYAFASIGRNWGTSIFAHEVGHILGMDHDAKNAVLKGDKDIYGFNKGRVSLAGRWYSIMAYDECTGPQGRCERIPFFTSTKPESAYNGEQTGILNVAENARMLDIGFPQVMNYSPASTQSQP